MIHLVFPQAVSREIDFYDREKETERINKAFMLGEQRLVFIIGERRIGKTSLMLATQDRFGNILSNRFVPFFFSERWYISSFKEFAKETLQRFCKYLGKPLNETGLLDDQGNFQEPNHQQLIDAFTILLKNVTNQIFILGIDEFDIFITQDTLPQLEAQKILRWIYHVIDEHKLPVVFLLSLSREPDLLRFATSTPLTALGDSVRLGTFSKEQMVNMVQGILKDQMVLDVEALERLYKLSAGHPFFVKLLLFHLLERYPLEGQISVTMEILDEALILAAVSDYRATAPFRNVYEVHMGNFEQKLLLLLARYEQGITKEKLLELGTEFEVAAKGLINRGYLVERPRGVYRYHIELLRLWVRHWDRYDFECHRLEVEMLKRMFEAEVIIDLAKREVRLKGEVRRLPPTVYCLLQLLCQRHDQLVTRNELQTQLDNCHGYGADEGDGTKIEVSSSIDVYISRLRDILGDKERRYIVNRPRHGYILKAERLSIIF